MAARDGGEPEHAVAEPVVACTLRPPPPKDAPDGEEAGAPLDALLHAHRGRRGCLFRLLRAEASHI